MEEREFIVNEKTLTLLHSKKNVRSFILKIRRGKLLLTTPYKYNEAKLNDFLNKRLPKWAKSIETKADNFVLSFNTESKLLLFGKNVETNFIYEEKRQKTHIDLTLLNKLNITSLWDIENENLKITIYTGTKTIDETKIIKLIYKKVLSITYDYYSFVVDQVALRYNVKVNYLKFHNLSGSWGLCRVQNKEVILSNKILHYPVRIHYYLIVHEVAHLVHKNHSREYWQLVSQQCPDWKNLRKELRW